MRDLQRRNRAGWPRARPAVAVLLLLAATACVQPPGERGPRLTMVIGIDVSRSFQDTGHFDDAVPFLARYIYGHLHALGGLQEPAALFVGSIGGETVGQPKAFHPIQDFQGRTVEQIEAELHEWFKPEDRLTDFNPFFEQVSELVKSRNLILKPLSIVVVSDGIPDVTVHGASTARDARYRTIDLRPIELLSNNVTVRLLYPDPQVNERWKKEIPRQRVRMWTVDGEVMEGWHQQVAPDSGLEHQSALWKWMADIVDFHVRGRLL